jgi:hypothetical protein
MGQGPAAEVSDAVARTMRGGAHVTLSWQTSVPDFTELIDCVGSIDFETDRCRLDVGEKNEDHADSMTVVLDGPATYTSQPDGSWMVVTGSPGTHSMFHPSGLLDAVAHAADLGIAIVRL